MKARSAGFTLIELMVVIAIIGILAAIAVPSFTAYITRSYRLDAYSLALPIKDKMEEFYAHRGRFPKNNQEAGLLPAQKIKSNYVASLEVENGAIHITYSDRAPQEMVGQVVSMRPSTLITNSAAPIVWFRKRDGVQPGRKLAGHDRTTAEW